MDAAETAARNGVGRSRINNRRYLGNKYRLLPFIRGVVDRECPRIRSVADIFAGTGAVASAFPGRTVITNDILYSNYVCNVAWFGAEPYDPGKVAARIAAYNALGECGENYMTEHFADTYFSRADCSRIGRVREDIERRAREGLLNGRERAVLIASLLYAMDRIARICGHYDAYRRGAGPGAALDLRMPDAPVENPAGNRCFNEDANGLARRIRADLVYVDPPYNSRQYCDAYHLPENVARWEKPEVSGVARKMDRGPLKSRYCTREAGEAFADLVGNIRADYILFSYNNMARKGNDRSNAKLSDEEILRALRGRGRVKVFSAPYRPFSAGKSSIRGNAERLFLCACAGRAPENTP